MYHYTSVAFSQKAKFQPGKILSNGISLI
jgi:hypothetical protein